MSLIGVLLVAFAALAADPIVAGSQPVATASPTELQVMDNVLVVLNGYVDIGFFDAAGDGVAYDRDAGLRLNDRPAPWMYHGDPWANAVNSQGDSADLGLDRTNVDRTDRVASAGQPTFLVNTWHPGIALFAGRKLQVRGELDIEPRRGDLGDVADSVSLDFAHLDWRPFDRNDLHVYVGQVESTFGIEYRDRHAPDRFGITPSAIARYTTGTPVGIKVRGSVRRIVWYSAAVTSGSTVNQRFGHFFDEQTGSARVAARAEGSARVELGISGSAGLLGSRQVGIDLQIDGAGLEVRTEALITDLTDGQGDWLRARGGYIEVAYHAFNWAGPLVRVDRRDAELVTGPNYYDSDTLRWTTGFRFDMTYNAIAKVEYVYIDELGQGAEIDDNVFTTSLVFRY